MAEASCSATELSQLIDKLMGASTSAMNGDVESKEKTLDLFERLKNMKVMATPLLYCSQQRKEPCTTGLTMSSRAGYACMISTRTETQV